MKSSKVNDLEQKIGSLTQEQQQSKNDYNNLKKIHEEFQKQLEYQHNELLTKIENRTNETKK